MRKIINFLLVFSSLIIFSQERKIASAFKFEKAPIIDGKFSKDEWSSVKPNSGFSVWVPETRAGIKIDPKYESTVYFGYDDYAIYVGAVNKHPDPVKSNKTLLKYLLLKSIFQSFVPIPMTTSTSTLSPETVHRNFAMLSENLKDKK